MDLQLRQLRNYEPSCESRVDMQLGSNKLQSQLRVKGELATKMKDKTQAKLQVKGGLPRRIKQTVGLATCESLVDL